MPARAKSTLAPKPGGVTPPRTADRTKRWDPPMRPQPGSQAERRAVQDLVARLDAQDAVPVAEMGALPDGPGIFLLRDAKGTVLHVGHSVDGPWSVEARRMAKAGQHVAALAISDRRITLLAWHLAVGHLLPVQLG